MQSLLRTLIIVSCIPFAACDDYHYRFFGAVNPTKVIVVPVSHSPFGTFFADSTIVAIVGVRGCPLDINTGDRRRNIPWRITTNPGAIMLEQDPQSFQTTDLAPFSGVLNGQDFSASATSNGNFLNSTTCLFRGSTLKGHFSPDFTSFDATEDLTFGQIGSEVRVQKHWVATRGSDQ
jgi:hypothetical protein